MISNETLLALLALVGPVLGYLWKEVVRLSRRVDYLESDLAAWHAYADQLVELLRLHEIAAPPAPGRGRGDVEG